jgi:hypothetical protein
MRLLEQARDGSLAWKRPPRQKSPPRTGTVAASRIELGTPRFSVSRDGARGPGNGIARHKDRPGTGQRCARTLRQWVKARKGRHVALRSVRAPVRQRFLVGAMANVALHLAGAGRGLAGPVVCDANDLAQAAAGAGIHRGTPVGEDRFGLCAAALAEDFGHCGHQHSAPHSDEFPFHRGTRPARATWLRKRMDSRGQTCANLAQRLPSSRNGGGRSEISCPLRRTRPRQEPP